MDQQCYQAADQTRNSNPDMLDTSAYVGHHHHHFGGGGEGGEGGGESHHHHSHGGDVPNGFHAHGEFRSADKKECRDMRGGGGAAARPPLSLSSH